ncbi:antitoxin VbhA family protein [Massilia agilis]|uniref:Antitoxin VbhA family protein n=1 Tax=Massilia agilis TaxID=1811226 RepID=A0ABT2DCZ6_9BURK|nr:antitoxin VbhA family protein [Massilia agilis]MCS0809191.1 antitoxin VbhA family protein [Massilia agilis]
MSKTRRQDVARMNASFALSGFTPDEQDLENQRRYILGELTLDDLLAHAQAFAQAQRPSGD